MTAYMKGNDHDMNDTLGDLVFGLYSVGEPDSAAMKQALQFGVLSSLLAPFSIKC
jgi:hypothetical protein